MRKNMLKGLALALNSVRLLTDFANPKPCAAGAIRMIL